MFTVESVRSAQYVTEDGSKIDCVVKFAEFDEELPFTADANDVAEHGREVHAALLRGDAGAIAAYAPPPAAPDPAVQAPPDAVG